MRRILLAVVGLALACACRREEKTPLPKCSDDVPRSDVVRLQGAVRSGVDPCPELRTPKVVLDSHGVTVDGMVKVAPADLPAQTPENIAPLFQTFVGKRRLWKEIHPGEKMLTQVELDAAPDASAVAGASVMRSIAIAGYPTIHLVSGDVTIDFDCTVPRPPGAPDDAEIIRIHTTGTMHDLANAVKDALAKPSTQPKREIAFGRR
ncbi:MAG TPA: hypothetical protein VGH28_28400 [Polyangiaceae bacterium]|jgi:hypothetical protein